MATIADHLRLRVYLLKRAVVSWIRREREAFHRAFELKSFRVWYRYAGQDWSKFERARLTKYQALLLTLGDSSPSVAWEVRFEPDDVHPIKAIIRWWTEAQPSDVDEQGALALVTMWAVIIWGLIIYHHFSP